MDRAEPTMERSSPVPAKRVTRWITPTGCGGPQDGPGDEFPDIQRRLEVILPREVVTRARAYLREKAIVTARRKRSRGEGGPMHRSRHSFVCPQECVRPGLPPYVKVTTAGR